MKFLKKQAELYIPDGATEEKALTRTTSLCIAAHQDDIEIMAYSAIADCFGKENEWFTGVVVTDGAGSPRSGVYEKYSDEEMRSVRATEQKNAASVGRYAAQFLLAYPSAEVKEKGNPDLVHELMALIELCSPQVVYTHNLADKHDTHVAVVLNVIEALRKLPAEKRPKKVFSLEVWRSLDWLCDEDKTVLDTSKHPSLAAALLGVYNSQNEGGKRYDLASLGRRVQNATFLESRSVDFSNSVSYGLDITELIHNLNLTPNDFISGYMQRFMNDVNGRIERLTKG